MGAEWNSQVGWMGGEWLCKEPAEQLKDGSAGS